MGTGADPREVRLIAASIVASWEAVEEQALAFAIRYGRDINFRERYASDMRAMLGGEQVYRAAKAVLEEEDA